jgi:hypothetical protein
MHESTKGASAPAAGPRGGLATFLADPFCWRRVTFPTHQWVYRLGAGSLASSSLA